MATEISKTQIDKLGDRLKKGEVTDADLRLLDEYRRSFSAAYEFVVGSIRTKLGLEPTGRPAKSTLSISDKLFRESIRLTQIQDIAGCRLIVSEMAEQERVVESLKRLFENPIVVDRRERPSHGYRAVHVIIKHETKLVEIQVRTHLQQAWAELSEKLSDIKGPAIKIWRRRSSDCPIPLDGIRSSCSRRRVGSQASKTRNRPIISVGARQSLAGPPSDRHSENN